MDYYTQFKQRADARCGSYFKTIDTLTKFLKEVTKRQEELRGKIERTQRHIADLHERAVDSIGGGQNSWAKYQTDVKKNEAEVSAYQSELENIESNILPNSQSRLRDAETNLGIILRQIILEVRKDADVAINELLRQCIGEYDTFLSAAGQLFADYGLGFVCNDESYCPSPWKADEIGTMRIKLGLVPNPEPTHDEIYRNYLSPLAVAAPGAAPVEEGEPPDRIEPERPGPDMPPTPAVPLVDDSVWGEPQPEEETEEVPAIADDDMGGATRT
jgi:hypothetical protein